MTPTKTPELTDVRDPHGRVIPPSIPTPPSVEPVAERVRQAVAHDLKVNAEVARLGKAVADAPHVDARAAIADPGAQRTEPALQAALKDAKAAAFASEQAIKADRREQHRAILAACPEWIPELIDGVADDRDAILAAIEQLDEAFRALARREEIIALLQSIQNGDGIWEYQATIDRVTDKQRVKAAERIETRVTSLGGLSADLQNRALMLEALRYHATIVADGKNPEAIRAAILRPATEAA